MLRYVELLGERRRGVTALKMRGSAHDKTIREYEIDAHGLDLGKAFREVGGILSGAPMRYILKEEEWIGGMFDDAESNLETDAST